MYFILTITFFYLSDFKFLLDYLLSTARQPASGLVDLYLRLALETAGT
jgi:hypothetical protein